MKKIILIFIAAILAPVSSYALGGKCPEQKANEQTIELKIVGVTDVDDFNRFKLLDEQGRPRIAIKANGWGERLWYSYLTTTGAELDDVETQCSMVAHNFCNYNPMLDQLYRYGSHASKECPLLVTVKVTPDEGDILSYKSACI